jgi:hypothetical protein
MTAHDPAADRIIAFLRAQGATGHGHGPGRQLLDHLVGTYEITRRWEQPDWLAHAALIHSVYGTEARRRALIPVARRAEVRAVAGEQAERVAFLFAATPRRLLTAGSRRWARGLFPAAGAGGDETAAPTRDELDAVVLLHLANLADQARAPDGSPAAWLVQLRDLAELIVDSRAVALPLFVATLAGVSQDDESSARRAYRDALAEIDDRRRADRLALAAAACPVVGEPCVWLADAAWRRGDPEAARAWARVAERRLRALGTAWDKRLGLREWLSLAGGLAVEAREGGGAAPADPRALYRDMSVAATGEAREPAAARARFQHYMELLSDAPQPTARLLYPGLDRRPWHDPAVFAPARELESHCEEIRDEILALDPARFTPESERIARRGEWDVVFLYERGRRHDDVCEACPVTTAVIEGEGAMRTAAGLIYVSRMRPGTHIQPHRGPTNLRLRCHLGITVPGGDCAIRVHEDRRSWSEGRCLVFDDSFEHEAWNRTDEDRIVLILDLWHPGLSSTEVHLLTGLHRYAAGYARQLERYWSVNDAARSGQPAN